MSRTTVVCFALITLALTLAACGSNSENARPANASTNAPVNVTANTAPATNAQANVNTQAPKAKLNLNMANGAEFQAAIPGFSNRMVHEFEEYRPYKSIQQFRKEIGKYVSAEQIAEYERYVFVPISVNESDAATLQQIPGLDATEAQALIAGRPYASNEAFLSKLVANVSADELAVAKTYLSDK